MMKLSACLLSLLALSSPALSQEISLRSVAAPLNALVGVDYHSPTGTALVSHHFSIGAQVNFARVMPDGSEVMYSDALGFTNEAKFTSIKAGLGGFLPGDLYLGNGFEGQIVRVTDGGATAIDPWVSLPGANGQIRGALHHDETGVFGGDLIVATTTGEVWRVHADGTTPGQPLVTLGMHLKGVVTLPDDPATYGVLAGKILVAGGQTIYAISSSGAVAFYDAGFEVQAMLQVKAGWSFRGISSHGHLLAGDAEDFAAYAPGVLVLRKATSGSGLYHMFAGPSGVAIDEIPLTADSVPSGGFRDGTFGLGSFGDIMSIGEILVKPLECALVFGGGPGNAHFSAGGYTWTTQLGGLYSAYPLSLTALPEFVLPTGSSGSGTTGGGVFSGATLQHSPEATFAVQILMYNENLYPDQPEQYTACLLVRVSGDGTVQTMQFGVGTGLQIWAETYLNAAGETVLRFGFSFPGMRAFYFS